MNSRSRLVLGGIAAVMVLSVAACGGSSATAAPATAAPSGATAAPSAAQASLPPAPTSAQGGGGGGSAAVDASTILTQDIATSIIGGTTSKISVPIPAGSPMSIAGYINTTGGSVTVLVETIPAGAANSLLQTAIRAAGANGDLQPLSGLGDAAGKVVNAHDATVAFAKGSTLVVVYADEASATGTDLESKIEAVAQQIASKL